MQEWMTRIGGRKARGAPEGTGRSPATFRSHVTTRGALAGMFAEEDDDFLEPELLEAEAEEETSDA